MEQPTHLRSRSRGQQSLQSFKFPRSPQPPPSSPVQFSPVGADKWEREPAPRFDFGGRRVEQQGQGQGRSWGGGWRKKRMLLLGLCLIGVLCVGWHAQGEGEREGGRVELSLKEVQRVFAASSSSVEQAEEAATGADLHSINSPASTPDQQQQPPPPFQPSTSPPFILSAPPSRLPKCEKILLFTFKNWWGFGSEYLLYLRASALATKLGYTLLEDDSKWNYGRLTNYFAPRRITCIPPPSWANPKKSYPLGAPSWRSHPRLRYSRSVLSALDDWTREEYDLASLAAGLREKDGDGGGRDILPMGESLPRAFETVFGDLEEEVKGLWRLEERLEEEMEVLREKVGLDGERWEVEREGEGEKGGKGWRGWNRRVKREEKGKGRGRGPVIGIHVRLGDKAPEYAHDAQESGISNTFGNLTVYASAAAEAYSRLLPHSPHPLTPSQPLAYSPLAPPTLLLMTAEPDVLTSLAAEPLAEPFRVISTTMGEGEGEEVSKEEVRRRREEFRERVVGAYAVDGAGAGKKAPEGKKRRDKEKRATTSSSPTLAAGYDQATFNSLPLVERVLHTRAFVRDLTLLSKEADAFIVSASSNIGRLAMLLGGSTSVLGPLSPTGASLGGRIRSIDSYWYPTAYARAVWEKVVDRPDPDKKNKATVPLEQRKKGKGKKQRVEKGVRRERERDGEEEGVWEKVT